MNTFRTWTSLPLVLALTTTYGGPLVAAETIPVQSKPFSTLAIYPQHSAPATVMSDNHSRISAEISARIVDIPVRVGDSVKKGALLTRLAQEDFQLALQREKAALAALNAQLELAKYELKRARSLSKKKVVSEQLLKQRETDLNALLAKQKGQQVAVTQAQRQVDKTLIRAPFNATIVERLGQVGELAGPGTALLRIIDTDNLELAAKINAGHVNDLKHTQSAEFVSSGHRHALTLRVIAPMLDTQARTQEARLRFTNSSPLPGTAGQLIWTPKQASLPADLISQRDGKLGVFIQAETQAGTKARFVELPSATTGQPALTQFEAGTLIITDGRYRLRDGDTISLGKPTAQ